MDQTGNKTKKEALEKALTLGILFLRNNNLINRKEADELAQRIERGEYGQ